MNEFKRVGFFSDTHCGHRAGLTPPSHQSAVHGEKYRRIQIETWELFTSYLDQIRPIDIAIWVGDMVDGKGPRSGGTELIQPDMRRQANMALEIMAEVSAPVNRMVRGTPYHVSPGGEDWEDVIAKDAKASIGDHEWFDIFGTIVDVKHHIGGSDLYKGTQLTKEKIANLLWNVRSEAQPDSDIIVRGHLHHYLRIEDETFMAFICPALQAAATKYGSRRCKFPVTWGFLWMDFWENGKIDVDKVAMQVTSTKVRAEKL